MILDTYPGATFGCALNLIKTGYAGPLVTLRRSSDNATLDVYPLADGTFPNATVAAWMGAATASVTTWYDQTGNGRHLVQATAARQPTLTMANGKPELVCVRASNQVFQTPAFTVPASLTLALSMKMTNASFPGNTAIFISGEPTGAQVNYNGFTLDCSGAGGTAFGDKVWDQAGSVLLGASRTTTASNMQSFNTYGDVLDDSAGTNKVYYNGVLGTTRSYTANSRTTPTSTDVFTVGGSTHFSDTLDCSLRFCALWPSALTTPNMADISATLATVTYSASGTLAAGAAASASPAQSGLASATIGAGSAVASVAGNSGLASATLAAGSGVAAIAAASLAGLASLIAGAVQAVGSAISGLASGIIAAAASLPSALAGGSFEIENPALPNPRGTAKVIVPARPVTWQDFSASESAVRTFDVARHLAPANGIDAAETITAIEEFTLSVVAGQTVSDPHPEQRISGVKAFEGGLVSQRFGNWQQGIGPIQYLAMARVTTSRGDHPAFFATFWVKQPS